MLALVLVCFLLRPKSSDDASEAMSLRDSSDGAVSHLSLLSAMLPYIQRMASLDATFPTVTWPANVMAAFNGLKLCYLRLSKIFRLVSPCALTTDHLTDVFVANAIVPWFFVVSLGAALLINLGRICTCVSQIICRRRRTTGDIHRTYVVLAGIVLFAIKLAHPGIGATFIATLLCKDIGHNAESVRRLVAEYQQVCDWGEGDYATTLIASGVGGI